MAATETTSDDPRTEENGDLQQQPTVESQIATTTTTTTVDNQQQQARKHQIRLDHRAALTSSQRAVTLFKVIVHLYNQSEIQSVRKFFSAIMIMHSA